MKSKRRHQESSDESEDSDVSEKSSSSSDSESDVSSVSDHRHKKKKKRADSSDSESDSDDQKRAKKRKHKKKKKKHGKKKRRSVSDNNDSDDNVSISEGEISVKKKRKHKHKHSKRAHGSSESADIAIAERRLHSVVKERRADSEEDRPSRTYYQKEYPPSGGVEYDRENEVERFYRGSSKDRRNQYQDNYYYEQERAERYPPQHKGYDRNREKYGQSSQYNEYNQRPREYDEYKRNPRYEDQPDNGYQKRRPEPYFRDDGRGNNKFRQYGDRGPMRKDFGEEREYHRRRGPPPEPEPYVEREFPEKRERYHEDSRSNDRDNSSENYNESRQTVLLLQRYFKFFTIDINNSRRV